MHINQLWEVWQSTCRISKNTSCVFQAHDPFDGSYCMSWNQNFLKKNCVHQQHTQKSAVLFNICTLWFDIILKILKTCEEVSSIDFGSELRWSSGPWTLRCLFSANQIHMQGSVGIPGLHHICVWQTKPSSRGFLTSSSTKLLEYPGDTTHNFFCALHYLFVENFNLECRKSIRVHNDLMCCFLLLHLVLYIISPLTRSKKFYCMFHLMEVSDWYRRVWTAVQ